MFNTFRHAVAAAMMRVRVNRIQEACVDGHPAIIKTRRHGAGCTIACGNLFLQLAGSGVHMFVRTRPWIDWEMECARLLYPDWPAACRWGRRSVLLPKMPGTSLRRLRMQGSPPKAAFIAAARELRRAHHLLCGHFGAEWSHGDLHLDNILYDDASDRAFLIDFDTRHERGMCTRERHADDLLLMVLELVATRDERWEPLAVAMLHEYGDPAVLGELSQRLTIPRGFAKILWHTRTAGCGQLRVESRLEQIRTMLEGIIASRPRCIPIGRET